MAREENQHETTKDRPASPGSSSWTAPNDTQESTQMSSTMLEAKATEAELDTTVAQLVDRVVRMALTDGRARNLSDDVIIETVVKALGELNAEAARDPLDRPDAGIADLVAEVTVRVQFPEAAPAEFGPPSTIVGLAVEQVAAAGGRRWANVTDIVRSLVDGGAR
jgi:hypothetical protein